MQHFIYFLVKYKYFLLFVLLEFFALFLIIQSHSFHQSIFVNSSNQITGSVISKINRLEAFVNLASENKSLLEENVLLKNKLENFYNTLNLKEKSRTSNTNREFRYISAKVIRNEFTKPNNYLTINKGEKDSVFTDMGAINEKGIIGIVNYNSKNYATIISILNQKLKINVKLKHTNYFGSLTWDAYDYNILQLIDLPRQAQIKIGDTIVTGGQSTIFPANLPVGRIFDVKKDNNRYTKIDIKLFNDMSNIGHVYLITNPDKKEIKTLENNNNIEQ